MIKNFCKKIFLQLTNKLVDKNLQIKKHFERQEKEKEWARHFNGNESALFGLDRGLKIKLYRENKLTEYILFHEFEKTELRFFELYLQPGDSVLDIGANIGFHTIHAGRFVGEEGKVYSFEPVLNTFHHLKENIAINKMDNVLPVNIGFSDKEGTALINVSLEYNAWNTLGKTEKMEKDEAGKFNGTEQIVLQKMDDWIPLHIANANMISLVKVDVEGWEKYVVLGGINYFKKNAPAVMMEFSDSNAFVAGYRSVEVYEMFTSLGYSWYRFDRDEQKMTPFPQHFSFHSENLVAVKVDSPAYQRLTAKLMIA